MARSLGIGPSVLRGRVRVTTHLYEDPDHPDRVTGTVESPAFTEEDRALLLALALYEGQLCSGCRQPIDVAWHSDMDGWLTAASFVCIGCTAMHGGEEVAYSVIRNEHPGLETLRPFSFEETTRPPSKP